MEKTSSETLTEQEYPDAINEPSTTNTTNTITITNTSSITVTAAVTAATGSDDRTVDIQHVKATATTTTSKDYKCHVNYEATTQCGSDCVGSTVERMPATPTPPSSPPGKRKNLTAAMKLELSIPPDVVTKKIIYVVDTDSSSTSSTSSSDSGVAPLLSLPAPTLPLNGIIHRRTNNNVEPNLNGNAECGQYDELRHRKVSGYGAPSLSSPQTPSLSSTNASTTPSSALLTSVSLTSSAASKSSTTNSTPQVEELMEKQLLQWQDMPHYLRFNPYILKGYRPLTTFKGCLLSLFYWHNETVNILTHALPIIYILIMVPGLMRWDEGYGFLSFCHIFGAVAPWCGSFLYHVFMNIEKGEKIYYTLLKMDMVGIWVSQSFGALPMVTATTLCFNPWVKWFIISSYCGLSLWGLYKALTATSPWGRRLCFALPFTMRTGLTVLRIRGLVGGSHMAMSHIYSQDGVSILGGAIGAMRIPEKWFPGLVDYYLNSHNIMHVLVVVAVWSMHKATIKDFEWMSSQSCNSYNVGNTTENTMTGHIVEL